METLNTDEQLLFRLGGKKMSEKSQELLMRLSSDEQLAEKLMAQETPEEAQQLLKEAGFDLNNEEILELRDVLAEMIEDNENGELSDETLSGVAGGAGGNIDPLGVVSWRATRSRGILPVENIRIRIRSPRGW